MLCLCRSTPKRLRRPYFHWENFTFNHEEQQRKHDQKRRLSKVQKILRRRHTVAPVTTPEILDHWELVTGSDVASIRTAPVIMVDKYQPPSGPPPSQRHRQDYQPPPGPPPSYRPDDQYRPPPGPPPSKQKADEYQPPPGPPPSHSKLEDYQPPPGPPPSHQANEPEPPPYDPWLAVPDSSALPPPPSFFQNKSNTANADEDEAVRAHQWCDSNPLWRPRAQNSQTLSRMQAGDVRLTIPPRTANIQLVTPSIGKTHVRTGPGCTDTIMLSDIPLYAAEHDSPLLSEKAKPIYFEVKITKMGNPSDDSDAGIAIGFLAPPYPAWRLPGWHRASFGVHGDDGRRYVNNTFGGQDFTRPFRQGDVVGIGMLFQPPLYANQKQLRCEVFFTRNGKRDGGWDLNEERDQEAGPSGVEGDPAGLGGELDLLAAVGCFGACEFEARFSREDWVFKP